MPVPPPAPLLDDMHVFVEVVDAGGFTAAAERLGLRKSTVSRRIAELEERLGVRLLERTTRRLRLTEPGAEYHRRCAPIISEALEANRAVAEARGAPRGTLRLSTTQVLGEVFLPEVLAAYLARHPRVEVEVSFSQQRVDLVAEGFDLALRVGTLEDSALKARPLGTARTGYYASPDYLRQRPAPRAPQALLQGHECVLVAEREARVAWPFVGPEGPLELRVGGRLRVGSVRVCHEVVRAGLGVGRLPAFLASEDVRTGRLVPVLEAFTPPGVPLNALYPGARGAPPKVRAFIDVLVEHLEGAPWVREAAAHRSK